MENVVSDRTSGTIETIDAHYELLARGQYVLNVSDNGSSAIPARQENPRWSSTKRGMPSASPGWTGAET